LIHNRLRYAFTAHTHGAMHRLGKDVKAIFYWFLQKKLFVEQFTKSLLMARGRLLKINRRFVDRKAIHEGKHTNIDTYWERTVEKLRADMATNKDKTMVDFVTNAGEIKDEVKAACIDKYLKRCELKHALAFF
jgi:hypothetical protein